MAINVPITSSFDPSGVNKAEKGVKGLGTEGKSSFGKMALGAAGATAAIAAVGAGIRLASDAVKAAAEDQTGQALFEEQLKLAGGTAKTTAAFDDLIAAGQKVAGFSDTELRTAYAQAYGQSKDIETATADVALAMDLARKTGKPLTDTINAVTKAQAGNTGALKKLVPELGSLVAGAGSSSEALALVGKNVDGLTETFAGSAQGQLARTTIQFDELKETLGAKLLPLLPVITGAIAFIIPIIEKIATVIGDNLIPIGAGLVALLVVLAPTIWAVVAPMLAAAAPVLALVAGVALLTAGAIWLYDNFKPLKAVVQLFRDYVTNFVIPVLSTLWDWITDVAGAVGDLVGWIGALDFGEIVDKAKQLGKDIVNKLIEGIKAAPGKLLDAIKGLLPDGLSSVLSIIPGLAQGGIVTGPTLALIGEAGPEAVIPLNKLASTAGGGINITVNGALDPVAVARQIQQLLNRNQARGIVA